MRGRLTMLGLTSPLQAVQCGASLLKIFSLTHSIV
jgi:hypothetical protein